MSEFPSRLRLGADRMHRSAQLHNQASFYTENRHAINTTYTILKALRDSTLSISSHTTQLVNSYSKEYVYIESIVKVKQATLFMQLVQVNSYDYRQHPMMYPISL